MNELPAQLEEIVEDFRLLDGQEKLEYLLYYAENLPPLPEWLSEKRNEMVKVHECMTPVFVYADSEDGQLTFYFDVPAESPTVRGFAAILREGLNDISPRKLLQVPGEFYLRMGLQNVLTIQRMNGFGAILARMKQLVAPYLDDRR